MLTLFATALFALVQADEPGKGRLPVQVPAGWEGKRQEGGFVLSPKDLAAGKVFTVISADLQAKLGSIKDLLEAGKATLAEAGTFKAAREPAPGKSDGGWDYELLVGTLEKGGGALIAQIAAFRKGEDEGLILVICDGTETLGKYSDGFVALLKAVGAPKPAPAAAASLTVDLKYTHPEGWTAKTLEGGVLLEQSKEDFYDKWSLRLLILPSQPLEGSLKQKFQELWTAHVKATTETNLVPLPLVRRLKSGIAVAFDQDRNAKNKQGAVHHATLYLLARGKRCVPVLGFYFGLGDTKVLEKALDTIFGSAEIPGSGTDPVALMEASEFPGTYDTTSVSLASYVTPTGQYAGDASISTGEYLTLGKDGSFSMTLIAITAKIRLKEKSEGTWKVEDDALLLTDKEGKVRSYRVFGVGADPKAGAYLVLSTYSNTDQQADLSIPRRMFAGTWFKRKD